MEPYQKISDLLSKNTEETNRISKALHEDICKLLPGSDACFKVSLNSDLWTRFQIQPYEHDTLKANLGAGEIAINTKSRYPQILNEALAILVRDAVSKNLEEIKALFRNKKLLEDQEALAKEAEAQELAEKKIPEENAIEERSGHKRGSKPSDVAAKPAETMPGEGLQVKMQAEAPSENVCRRIAPQPVAEKAAKPEGLAQLQGVPAEKQAPAEIKEPEEEEVVERAGHVRKAKVEGKAEEEAPKDVAPKPAEEVKEPPKPVEEVKDISKKPEEKDAGGKVDLDKMNPEQASKFMAKNAFMFKITQMLASKQKAKAVQYRLVHQTSGAVTWINTHFIFIIDASGSMKGNRSRAMEKGFNRCVNVLKQMKDIMISCFMFDDIVTEHCKFQTPIDILRDKKPMKFSWRNDTQFSLAMDQTIKMMTIDNPYPDYMSCIVFMSDGDGGYPEKELNKLLEMRKSGRQIMFMSFALMTTEDANMLKMAKLLDGEHYSVSDADSLTAAFLRVVST